MRASIFLLVVFSSLSSWSQNAQRVYDQAIKDYYDLQYTAAISGFQQTKDYYASTGDKNKSLKSYYYLAMSSFELENINDALTYLYDGSGIAIDAYGEESSQSADFYIGYGKYYHYLESYDTAKMFYQGALELKDEKRDPVIVGEIYANLGYACDYNAEYDSAIYYYQKAAKLMESSLGTFHRYTQWIYSSIPYVAQHAGKHQIQVDAAKKSLEISNQIYGSGNEDELFGIRQLATAYEWLGDAQNQKKYFEEAQLLCEKLHGKNSEEYATALTQLGNAYSALNEVDDAVALNKQSYELRKRLLGQKHPKTLDVLRNIGNVYYDGGRYTEAMSYYQQNFDWQSKINGKNSKEMIQPLLDMAQVYENTGKHAEAEELYQKALSLQQKHAKDQMPQTYIALARIQDDQSKFQESLETLNKALLANLNFNSGDLETEAFIKNNIGTIYREIGQYKDALTFLNESLEARTSIYGVNSAKVAQVVSNIGNVYLDLGENKLAEEAFLQTLDIEIAYYGINHPQIGGTYMSLASVGLRSGDIRHEINLLHKAEKIYIAANGSNSPELIRVYNNLSIAYIDLVLLDSALYYAELHGNLAMELFGKNSMQMADNMNLKAIVKNERGFLNEAFELYKQAIALYEAILPNPNLDLAAVYNNLGLAYNDFREYTQAQDYLEASLRIHKNLVGENHDDYRSTLMNLGLVEYNRSNYNKAKEIYLESIKPGALDQRDSLFLATVYQNLGLIYSANLEWKDANAVYEKAVKIRTDILGENNLLTAELFINNAVCYRRLKEYKKAIENTKHVEQIYALDQKNVDKTALSRLYLNISDIYTDMKTLDQAMKYADMALKQCKGSYNQVYSYVDYFGALVKQIDLYYLQYLGSKNVSYLQKSSTLLGEADQILTIAEKQILNDEDRIKFSGWKGLFTMVGLKNALAMHQTSNDPKYLEEAFYYAERSKANTLIDAIYEQRVKTYAGIDQKLVDRETELKAAIQEINVKIFKLDEQSEVEKYENLRNQLFVLNREYDEVVKKLRSNKRYQKLSADYLVADLASIRSGLDDDEAVIELAASDSTIHVFLVTKTDLKVFSKSMESNEAMDEMLMRSVNSLLQTIAYQADKPFERISTQIYNLVLADAEAYMKAQGLNIHTLTIVPEGMFSYFPFESIRREEKYLIEDYNIRYSYSMTLTQLQAENVQYLNNESLLTLAPVFNDEGTSKITPGARAVFDASRSMGNEEIRGFSVNGQYISALPGTKSEVEAINALMKEKGRQTKSFLYDQANEELVKSGILKEYQYIHFATHGFVNDAAPAYSGVFLSQNENSEEDCILFASEIYGLDIQADLVALSACETGLGRFENGEGIVGLTRAFLFAGAKNLLVSQWQVSDASTAKMMVDFYKHVLAGENKTVALREAKLALIKDPKFNAPYYWAPFVLIGR